MRTAPIMNDRSNERFSYLSSGKSHAQHWREWGITMHKLRSVTIFGFRGQKSPISIKLADDANFIIGRNGTGKTTLINLINAALSIDLGTLRITKFDRIEMKLKAKGSAKVSTIRVERQPVDDYSVDLNYSIFPDSRSSPEVFTIPMVRRRSLPTPSGRRPVPMQILLRELRSRLDAIFKAKWLSLRRGEDESDEEETEYGDRRGTTDVDRKLDQVLSDLVRYFSRLDRQAAEKTAEFQKHWFLSFLATDKATTFDASKIDMAQEKKAIVAIFEKFGVPPGDYEAQIDRHFKLAERASSSFSRSGHNPLFKDFLVVYDVTRLHTLVEQWEDLLERQKEIYKPKNDFTEICSEMLFRKSVVVNRSNQVTVINDSDREPIRTRDLSSGEKQLLIFLSETLLQEQNSYIFLADEPELSLHIEWQLELVPNLLKINPQAQVIFATHSPDVVGAFQNRLIKMEKLVD